MADKKVETLNYSTQAQDFIGQLLLSIPREELPQPFAMIKFVSLYLERAIKFMLPVDGLFFESSDFDPKFFDLLHLPYPMCALEFEASEKLYDQASGLNRAPKRIALCFDPHALPEDMRQWLNIAYGKDLTTKFPPRAIAIMAVYETVSQRNGRIWGPAQGLVVLDLEKDRPVPTENPGEPIEMHYRTPSHEGFFSKRRTAHGLPATYWPFMALSPRRSKDEVADGLYVDTIDEVRAVYDFLGVINCANVRARTVAAPKALNAKRAKKGKPLFHDYKVLDLAPVGASSAAAAKGSHASPVMHLRRGHLRRLNEKQGGKTIFIQPTMVNAQPESTSVTDRYRVKGRPAT